MRSVYYSAVARSKLAAKSRPFAILRRSLSGVPLLGSTLHAVKRSVARALLPKEPTWVRAESGLAQGLWLLLNLDVEGDYWVGTHEPSVQNFLKKVCTTGSVFYDVGTNLGFFSLAVAGRLGPAGRVYGFEPEPENTRRLQQMIVRNELQDRVTVVEAAVWSYSSAAICFEEGGRQRTYGGVAADGIRPVLAKGKTRFVKALSLDDFVGEGHPAPHVIKIDVEGGECEALKGARRIFAQARPFLVCEVHRQEAADWIANWLAEMDYAAEWHVPAEMFPRMLFSEAMRPSSLQAVVSS